MGWVSILGGMFVTANRTELFSTVESEKIVNDGGFALHEGVLEDGEGEIMVVLFFVETSCVFSRGEYFTANSMTSSS